MESNSAVIIRVINKMGRPRSGSPIVITERIGRHKVLLLINHNHNKICDILSFWSFQRLEHRLLWEFFVRSENKTPFNFTCCPIT